MTGLEPRVVTASASGFQLPLTEQSLRDLFTKPYGAPAPSHAQWKAVYAADVHFEDPTQSRDGLQAYLEAQDGLVKRCDDVYLAPHAVVINGQTASWNGRWGSRSKASSSSTPERRVCSSMATA